jgi:hypothetical protein
VQQWVRHYCTATAASSAALAEVQQVRCADAPLPPPAAPQHASAHHGVRCSPQVLRVPTRRASRPWTAPTTTPSAGGAQPQGAVGDRGRLSLSERERAARLSELHLLQHDSRSDTVGATAGATPSDLLARLQRSRAPQHRHDAQAAPSAAPTRRADTTRPSTDTAPSAAPAASSDLQERVGMAYRSGLVRPLPSAGSAEAAAGRPRRGPARCSARCTGDPASMSDMVDGSACCPQKVSRDDDNGPVVHGALRKQAS